VADRLPKGDSPEPDEPEAPDDYYRPTYFGPSGRRNRKGWLENRRDKAATEIARNRSGDFKVPTWVLGAALAAIILFWAILLILN
jgi:hypothetical protein